MKKYIFILFFTINGNCFAQSCIYGLYNDEFGHTITLKKDSSFYFEFSFDLAGSWSQGKWNINQTDSIIELIVVPLYDTLQVDNKDTFVLSSTRTSKRIDKFEYIAGIISGRGQNRILPPLKLKVIDGKLYTFNNKGKLIKKKEKGMLSNQKYRTWYIKE